MFGKLTSEEIEKVLQSQPVGRIGCHADGQTYVVPISYVYDAGYIYCYTQEGKKTAIMRANPQVCFQTDDMNNMANWKSVIAWGEYEELSEGTRRREALKKLTDRVLPMISSERSHVSADWPFTSHETEQVKGIIFRIRLTEKTGRFERSTRSAGIA